ncbi:MAG: microviridin/marinostatin family tricyclic proteinase inhibitor [Myxococcaceae bacterium]
MTRISGPRVPAAPKFIDPPAVKAETKKTLKAAFESALKSDKLQFHAGGMPLGERFVRVPLKAGKGADQYSYTALIPAGALAPGAKPSDPNKAKSFFIERSGGFAGITMVAGPVTMGAKGKVTVEPFFGRFLEGQQGAGGTMHTMKAPSDNEDGGGQQPGGGVVHTMKAPSDNEDGGGQKPKPPGGGVVHTMKAPSDNEDGGGARPKPPAGGVVHTMKAPSDNEDGGGARPKPPGGGVVHTMKAPSDNEDGGGARPKPPGGGVVHTMKAPSDNEDGGGTRPGGGVAHTMKFPSDNEDGAR